MSQLIDSLIIFRILHILLQPIEKSDAYRLGVIDNTGKKLKNPVSSKEKDSYTLLNRLVFKIKSIMNKNPSGERDLRSFTTALHLAKECYTKNIEPENIQEIFEESLKYVSEEDINNFKDLFVQEEMKSFLYFLEDAPANNASATPGVAGFTPDTLGVKTKQKILKRKKPNLI